MICVCVCVCVCVYVCVCVFVLVMKLKDESREWYWVLYQSYLCKYNIYGDLFVIMTDILACTSLSSDYQAD